MDRAEDDEIQRLKDEVARLKKLLNAKGRDGLEHESASDARDPKSDDMQLLAEKARSASLYGNSSYIKIIAAMIKGSWFWRIWLIILTYFRRLRLLSYIASFISYSIALLGTGALLLVYLSATALFLISASLLFLLFIIVASADIKKANRLLLDSFRDKDLYIFFQSGNEKKCGFFAKNALDFSKIPNSNVLIVTNSLFFVSGTHRFLALKQARKNVFIIRKFYYFTFKKRVLPHLSKRIFAIF